MIPIYAVETLEPDTLESCRCSSSACEWFIDNRPELAEERRPHRDRGMSQRRLLAIVNPDRLRRILRAHARRRGVPEPARHALAFEISTRASVRVQRRRRDLRSRLRAGGVDQTESFGGNSNWRGPVWFPVNYLLIESLQKFHYYYGDEYKVEFPTGSGTMLTLWEVAQRSRAA